MLRAGMVAVLAIVERAHGTDGLEPIGVSVPANARGGADVAVGDSALSQVENPATLALWRRYRFDLAGQLGFCEAPWTGVYETASSHRQLIPLGNVGLAWPLDRTWTAGLALHSKAGLGTDYEARHLLIPWIDRRVGGDLKVLDLQFNLAARVTDRFTLGGGVRAETATARFSTVLGPADLDFSRSYAHGGGFQLGATYRPREDVTLGLAYRSPTWFSDLQGGAARLGLLGFVPVPLGAAEIPDLTLPQRIAGGVTWDATERLRLMGEVRWLNYDATSFNSTTVETDGWINLRYPFPLGYRDQWAFIAGAEYRLTPHWVLGTGYHFATAPVDGNHMLPIGSTISQHHATIGLRYEQERWWAGVGYVLGFPTTLRSSGHSRIPLGVDYNFGALEQTQHILALGFGVSW